MEQPTKNKNTSDKIYRFLENHCNQEFVDIKDTKSISIDFRKIISYDPTLAEQLLENFEEVQQLFSTLAKIIKIDKDGSTNTENVYARFSNIVAADKDVWKIRVKDVDTFVAVSGHIRRISDVRHRVTVSRYECIHCGHIVSLQSNEGVLRKPQPHNCIETGGRWKVISKELEDVQKLVLEEDVKPPIKPRSILCELTADLCRAEIDKTLQPSKKVRICGVIKSKQLKKNETECTKYLSVNNINVIEDSISTMKITNKEIKEFKELSNSETLYEDLAQSIVPNVEGNEDIKLAVLLQLIGGVQLDVDDTLEERGTIHILLVSSPGTAKTMILRRATKFIPGSILTSGKGVSGVGLVATVIKDEELGGWSLDIGAIPRANGAVLGLDELDKIKREDIAHMNACMTELKVRIDKASVHTEIETNVSILAAANPKNRVFDKQERIWKQIGLPKDFLDRFDLIFPIIPSTKESDRRKVAKLVISKHKAGSIDIDPIFPKEFVIKYIAYAKRIKPEITQEVQDYIIDNFINIMKPSDKEEDASYFSYRLLTNIVRLTQAVAKTRLSKKATVENAQKAITLLVDSLKAQDIITPSGLFNFEIAEGIVPKKKRNIMRTIKEVIRELEQESSDRLADWDLICQRMKEKDKSDPDDVDELLDKLKQLGDIFETRKNKFKLI